MLDMAKKGTPYPVDDDWRRAVEKRMQELDLNKNELAKRLGVAYATVHNLLSGSGVLSTIVPEVHRIFGWPEPSPLVLSRDSAELQYIIERLTPDQKGSLLRLAKDLEKSNR